MIEQVDARGVDLVFARLRGSAVDDLLRSDIDVRHRTYRRVSAAVEAVVDESGQ